MATTAELRADKPLEFNRDIRPILSENCFYCHGRDANKRQGSALVGANVPEGLDDLAGAPAVQPLL